MFEIDRSYIESADLESLQGRIWDIRTDHKDDPTLPKIQNYNISEEEFETYLERKQNFEDFKSSWRKNRLVIFGIAFCIPLAIMSLLIRGTKGMLPAYAVAFLVCLLVYLVYALIASFRAHEFRNNPSETFIKALISWDDYRQQH